MLDYALYKDLLDLEYKEGSTDCFGLVRQIYCRAYGIVIPNFARPSGFETSDLDLYSKALKQSGFNLKSTNVNFLNVGDVLAFRFGATVTNHLGVYLGNDLFLHHVRGDTPREDNLDPRWQQRLIHVLDHVDVPAERQTLNFVDFIPPNLRGQLYAL